MQYLSAANEAAGFQFVGYADGYEIDADRSDALIPEACELARSADVALVFLGPGARRGDVAATRCVKLPPNQLALVDARRGFGFAPFGKVRRAGVDKSFDGQEQSLGKIGGYPLRRRGRKICAAAAVQTPGQK